MNTTLYPYLCFNGNCKEAMEFYQSVLGGELTLQTFGEAPGVTDDDDTKNLIMHADLKTETLNFFGSDDPSAGGEIKFGHNISLCLGGTDLEALTGAFNALCAGGTVQQELTTAVWGNVFGMFSDKFGMDWMVNISKSKD